MLMILTKGKLEFRVGEEAVTATAPSFLCFDESENPVFSSKSKAHYTLVYFHPQFLNLNMTFAFLRSNQYSDIATTHDMFLLKPFTDKAHVLPIIQSQAEKIAHAADCMAEELIVQRDQYWSCRGRSYFMEILIALERIYGLIGYGVTHRKSDDTVIINDPKPSTMGWV